MALEGVKKKSRWVSAALGDQRFGAGNRTRTGDINLGKVALYQLSYARVRRARRVRLPRATVKLTEVPRNLFPGS